MSTEPLPHLETFAEAAERGSFTAAARHLGLTQAAVSQRIRQLEAALGTPLFRRAAGGATLTGAGRRLHAYARRILDLTAEARAAVTGTRDEVGGDLELAASSVPGQHLLPPVLAAFRGLHPLVRVRVAVSDTDLVLRQVGQGRAHLGLVGGQGDAPDLEFRRFARDELVLVVPEGHAWWGRRRVSVSDLLAQPFVQREAGSGSRRCLERALERLGVVPSRLNVVLELGSNEAVKGAVLERAGVAVLSRRAVEGEVEGGRLRAVPVDGLTLDRAIYVVRDRRRALPGPAHLFLALVRPEPEAPGGS
ncbi:MAG: LysR family transcriptional regulator [Gemmataceae bacterium]|nr:LysR family transcriptional regulator [Gemmataceae bacterium]